METENQKNLSFQIISDLHIEYKNNIIPHPLKYITPKSPILILAGDIGSLYKMYQLKGFLTEVCKLFDIVFYIPGNHEYYTQQEYDPVSFESLSTRLHSLEKDINNLYILDRSSVVINDICITGCTLWSHSEVKIPKFIVRVHGMTTQIYNQKHHNDLKYINKMIEHCSKNKLKLVVVTHHCPSFNILDNLKSPLYSKDNNNNRKKDKYVSLYFSSLDSLLEKSKVDTWICGHIHQNFDFVTDGGTRLIGNQFGKPRDNICDYDKELVVNIENNTSLININEKIEVLKETYYDKLLTDLNNTILVSVK